MSRWTDKADALVHAWVQRYASRPTMHGAIACLAVADLETGMGDYLSSHNWGQIQRRQLSPEERAELEAGKPPRPRDTHEVLSYDTSPTSRGTGVVQVRYAVWLWRFPDDISGADKLLEVLLDRRPPIKAKIDTITMRELAALMYASRYYEGSHPRDEIGGPAANIAAYGSSLETHQARILAQLELARWTPETTATPIGPPPPRNVPSLAPSSTLDEGHPLVSIATPIATATPIVVPIRPAAPPAPPPAAPVGRRRVVRGGLAAIVVALSAWAGLATRACEHRHAPPRASSEASP